MNNKTWLVILLIVLISLMLITKKMGHWRSPNYLVADTVVSVYDSANVDPANRKTIGVIKIGQMVEVTGCIDIKHYLVPVVLLSDGKNGYVIDGRFHYVVKNLRTERFESIDIGC